MYDAPGSGSASPTRVRPRLTFAAAAALCVAVIAWIVSIPVGIDAAAQDAPAAAKTLAGTIVDDSTSSPIPNATVRLWRFAQPIGRFDFRDVDDWPSQPICTVRSDARGAFSVPDVPAVDPLLWLSYSAPGYAPAARFAVAFQPRVALNRSPPVRVRLTRESPSGPVPAAGVEVLVVQSRDVAANAMLLDQVVTGADGTATVSLPERCEFIARGRGLAVAGLRADRPDVLMTPGAPISGLVVDDDGQGVPESLVAVTGGPVVRFARTNAAGEFRMDGVPCGPIPLFASCGPHVAVGGDVPVWGGDTFVRVPKIVTGYRLIGRAEFESSSFNSRVRLLDPDAKSVDDANPAVDVDFAGGSAFRLETRGPGPHIVLASAGKGWSVVEPVIIPAGTEPVPVTIRFGTRPIPEASLRIVDPTGAPVVGAEVSQVDSTLSATTDSDGNVTVRCPQPTEGRGPRIRISTAGPPIQSGETVVPYDRLRNGAAEVVVAPPVEATLRLVLPDGKPAPADEYTVTIDAPDGGPEVAFLAPRGVPIPTAAGERLPRGVSRRVTVVRKRSGLRWEETVTAAADAKAPVTIDVPLRARAVVTGRIAPRGDATYTAVLIPVKDRNLDRFTPGRTNVSKGVVRIEGVAPGEWWLCVVEQGTMTLTGAKKITVDGRGAVADAGDLAGTVVQLKGTVSHAGHRLAGGIVAAVMGPNFRLPTMARPDGTWTLTVPRGADGRLEASRIGLATSRMSLASATPDRSVDFRLEPASTLFLVHGRDAFRRPVPLTVTSASGEVVTTVSALTSATVLRDVAPGPVKIRVGVGDGAPVVEATAEAWRTTIVDLEGR